MGGRLLDDAAEMQFLSPMRTEPPSRRCADSWRRTGVRPAWTNVASHTVAEP
jgi:hypothetical protein